MRKNLIVLPLSLALAASFLCGCNKDVVDTDDISQETTTGSSDTEESVDYERAKQIFADYDQEFYRHSSNPSPSRDFTFDKILNGDLKCSLTLAKKEVTSYKYGNPYVTTYEYGDGKLLRGICRGDLTEYTYSGDKLIEERFTYDDYELLIKYSYEGDRLVKYETWKNGEWFASFDISYDGDLITKICSDYADSGRSERNYFYENGQLVKKGSYDADGNLGYVTQYIYDDKGNVVKTIQHREDFEDLSFEYSYDENGFVTYVKQGYCDEDGSITQVTFEGDIKYGLDSELMQSLSGTTYFEDSSIETYTECIFDENGRIVSYKSNYPDGTETAYTYEYILDDKDRLTQSIKTNEITGSLEETVDYYYYD